MPALNVTLSYRVNGTTTWTDISPTGTTFVAGTVYDIQLTSVDSTGRVSSSMLQATPSSSSGGLPGDTTGIQAKRIGDMLRRFGVNTFSSLSVTSNVWGAYPADYSTASVIAGLNWLTGTSGHTVQVREYHYNGRESIQTTWCPAVFAGTGAKITMAIGAGGGAADVTTLAGLASASHSGAGWMLRCEGINEPNNDFGSGAIPAATTISVQQALNTAVAGLGLEVCGPSIVFGLPYPEGYITPPYMTSAQLTSINAASVTGNAHLYPPGSPDQGDGSTRSSAMNDVWVGLRAVYASHPLIITEWHPTLYNSATHSLDPTYDAYYAPMFFLSAYREGFEAWFWYALLDYGTAYLSGLFPQTGGVAPRPVAYTIRAMFTLSPDTGASAMTFATTKLNYTVSGGQAPLSGQPNTGCQSMLFQGSDGTFYLYLWNSQVSPGGTAQNVTVAFPSHAMTSVKDYKITDTSSSTAPTTAIQNLSSVSSVTVSLNASVHLLVIHY